MKVLILNGANINFIGLRDKSQYGSISYEDICSDIYEFGSEHYIDIEIFQSNHEGKIIDKLQEAYMNDVDAVIINPGAFTHYSYAIRDALEVMECKKIEVHVSNVFRREEFRSHSVTAQACDAVLSGFGCEGYIIALKYLID
jgi:3-dehydroquinate dehydratase, type II